MSTGAQIAAANAVELYAGYELATSTYKSADTLTVDGEVSGSTIGLFAGGAITTSGTLTGVVTEMPFLYSASPLPPSPPLLADCIATPGLPGCDAVLPTLAECTTTPSTAGCSVVLPTLAACAATPTIAGCSAVLPSLAQCTVTPTLAGCGSVLPGVEQCLSNPLLGGCVVVLPPTQGTTPVDQVSNTILATLTTQTVTTTSPASTLPSTTPAAGGSSTVSNVKQAETKDEKKDEKKDLVANDKPGAPKNDTAAKMYCN